MKHPLLTPLKNKSCNNVKRSLNGTRYSSCSESQ
uniref:Bm13307 n=1 Tax=Brugia malayi TaxID=6279 RepID=A0A1I9G2D3_BRUMA|nr:Bm13307 [Brugia malayi]